MNTIIRFGLSHPTQRTESGALRSMAVEQIRFFLHRRGMLVVECFDRHLVFVHPSIVGDVCDTMTQAGLQPLVLGATLESLRQTKPLTIAEVRVFELLTPGDLIIIHDDEANENMLSYAIPDNHDIRDICSTFGGTMQCFVWDSRDDWARIYELYEDLHTAQRIVGQLGILEFSHQMKDAVRKPATIVKVYGPGNVKCIAEGSFDAEIVSNASQTASQWEMGEWI